MHWLLLRGLVRERRHWAGFTEHFERTLPGSTVHLLDLPGIGTEAHRPSPLHIDAIVDDLRRRWLELPLVGSPTGIFSVSLGAMIAIRWCRRFPQDWDRAVLTNTSAADLGHPFERFNWRTLRHFPTLAQTANPELRERTLLRIVSANTAEHSERAQHFAVFAPDKALFRNTGLRQILAGSRVRVGKGPLPQPTLVLASSGDRLVDPVCSLRLARRISAPMRVHPWGGHDLVLDAPEWITEQMRHWLEELAQPVDSGVPL